MTLVEKFLTGLFIGFIALLGIFMFALLTFVLHGILGVDLLISGVLSVFIVVAWMGIRLTQAFS